MEYNFREVEKKWQQYWAANKTYKAENQSTKPKYYVLDMFPYPSGAGLHVGHPLGYIASDIFARYKRLKGFNVLHPMGYDSFGLPAEQYAIQTGQHPEITTKTNIARYREQLDKIGFSFDWDREVRTSNPDYYKWTQWIFIQLFNSWYNKKTNKAENISTLISCFESNGFKGTSDDILTGDLEIYHDGFTAEEWKNFSEANKEQVLQQFRLAYLSDTMVNWCPQLGTVLANEEVKDGVSERGGYPVERKLMKQWSLRITAYADRLLNDLEGIDWTESIKEAQRNWIGRSDGTSLKFKVENSSAEVEVFTTRPDTIFGVSFVTLAPEHELVAQITTATQKNAVDEYVTFAKNRSERERMADVKKITGVFTGAYVIHPFTGKQIPIWIGDYVLAGYGTGAVMAVPGHDSRDYAFAKHFDLPIIEVVAGGDLSKESYDAKEGKLINSDFLNGLEVKEAIKKAIAVIEEKGLGKGKTNFRLRDAIFGRQRYWGEPIPVYYKDGIPHVLKESELPLMLPEVDKYLPTETGEPPLARAKDWKYEGKYEYEYSTMPGWAGSSWYFLRYMDAHNEKTFVSKEAVDYWQNVDLYIGGAEHATGHLLYVRFWTKFLNDLGLIPVIEPAKKLINQGMIQGESAFVIICTFPKIEFFTKNKELKINNIPPIYISKGKALEIEKGNKVEIEKYLSFCNDILVEFNPDFKNYKFNDLQNGYKLTLTENCFHTGEAIPGSRTPIEYVSGKNILDIGHYSAWRAETYKNLGVDISKLVFKFYLEDDAQYICHREVEKMSKSKWNVVTPDTMVEQYGADCLRLYEMFLGPLELSKPWNTNGITGVSNFIRKLWRLYHQGQKNESQNSKEETFYISEEKASKDELKALHKTIKKISSDIENFSFNTSVSNFMICVNELTDLKCNKREVLEPLTIIIAPYAPHIAEELWNRLGHSESITYAAFPECNESYLVESSFNYPVSFNGKTRFFQEYDLSLTKEQVEKEVLTLEQTQKYLEGKTPKKVIVVHNKIVNIVI
ncbi:MAG: leucine--tRNA ligase [Bacteroidetes bacterium]|nr:leucine--tRNA ligase [Bacteroidota bacterium]